MKKIKFEAGTQVSPAKVTIDNVEHNVIPAVYEGNTPLSPFVLNTLQDNVENEIITSKITDISEALTITDCAGVNGKLDIKSGKSEQKTRSGYNLCNSPYTIDNKFTQTATKDDHTFVDVLNSYATLEAGVEYTISFESDGDFGSVAGTDTVEMFLLKDKKYDNMFVMTSKTGKFTPEVSGDYYIRVDINKNGCTHSFWNFFIRKSTETRDFELYGASPSPDYPSDIRNVGDNINLFDKDNANIINCFLNYTTNKIEALNGVTVKTLYIPIRGNKDYTVSKITSARFVIGTSIETPTYNVTLTNSQYNNSATKLTITSGANDKYLSVFYYLSSADTLTEQEILDSIKIEEGSIATPYTPYNCGCVDLRTSSDNIFDRNTDIELDGQFRGYGNGNISTGADYYGIKVQVKSNTSYITDSEGNRVYSNLCFFDKNMTYLSGLSYSTEDKKFTTPNNCEYITLAVHKGIVSTFQLKEINDIVFPLSQGQLLHKGDYLAEDGIHQKRTTIILDGTEGWSIENNVSLSNYRQFRVSYFVNARSDSFGNADVQNCTHFKCIRVNDINEYGFTVNGLKQLAINYDIVTVNEFKTYLAEQYANGTPVTIEYELAEETITPYTEKQEQAYYELQHLLMYEGYTSIECIDEIKPDIQVEYSYNNEINTTYGKKIDTLEARIRQLEQMITS